MKIPDRPSGIHMSAPELSGEADRNPS
jgi:hypothetical protein